MQRDDARRQLATPDRREAGASRDSQRRSRSRTHRESRDFRSRSRMLERVAEVERQRERLRVLEGELREERSRSRRSSPTGETRKVRHDEYRQERSGLLLPREGSCRQARGSVVRRSLSPAGRCSRDLVREQFGNPLPRRRSRSPTARCSRMPVLRPSRSPTTKHSRCTASTQECDRDQKRDLDNATKVPHRIEGCNSPTFSSKEVIDLINTLTKMNKPESQPSTLAAPLNAHSSMNNKNILPDFDPSSKSQRIDTSLKKVNECATV